LKPDIKKMKPKFTLEVYEDHAIIRGKLKPFMLLELVKIFHREGFLLLTSIDDSATCFKLSKHG
jgi:hypothetical protein